MNPLVVNDDAASPSIVGHGEVIERCVLSCGHACPAAPAAAGAAEGGGDGSWGEKGEGGAKGEDSGNLKYVCMCIDGVECVRDNGGRRGVAVARLGQGDGGVVLIARKQDRRRSWTTRTTYRGEDSAFLVTTLSAMHACVEGVWGCG